MTEESQPRPGLPPNAKLVFKGVIFEVWQWEQKMFDGSTTTFEKIWRCPTVEVIVTVGDKILIEKQEQPDRKDIVSLPGGRADKGDDPLEEAKRELLEETGYESTDWSLLLTHGKDGKVIHEQYFFIARDCKKVKEAELDAGEKITTSFISFDEFLALADDPHFWTSPEFIIHILAAKFDSKKKEELRATIFPPSGSGAKNMVG
jgi:ADP-ribose pyrophosphatase